MHPSGSIAPVIEELSIDLGFGMDFDISSQITSARSKSAPLAQPGPLDPGRWPEQEEALSYVLETARVYGLIVDRHWRAPIALRAWVRNENDPNRPNAEFWAEGVMDQFMHFLGKYEEAINEVREKEAGVRNAKDRLDRGTQDEDDQVRMKAALFALKEAEAQADSAWRAMQASVGFPDDLPDPTIPGRTWLCSWQVMRQKDDRPFYESHAVLVIAGPGMILQEGASFLAVKAEDLKLPDAERDCQAMRLKSMPVRLSRGQCLAWGKAMHWKGRVVYASIPETQDGKPRRGPRPRVENQS